MEERGKSEAGFPAFCVGVGLMIGGLIGVAVGWIAHLPTLHLFAALLTSTGAATIALAVLYGRHKDRTP